MNVKFSANFERDWEFYHLNRHRFNIDPANSATKRMTRFQHSPEGKTAKECFYIFDSSGKGGPCCEMELLQAIFNCKASVNFHIKMWAEHRAEMLSWIADKESPLDVRLASAMTAHQELEEIQTDFQCPDWVIKAVVEQAKKVKTVS